MLNTTSSAPPRDPPRFNIHANNSQTNLQPISSRVYHSLGLVDPSLSQQIPNLGPKFDPTLSQAANPSLDNTHSRWESNLTWTWTQPGVQDSFDLDSTTNHTPIPTSSYLDWPSLELQPSTWLPLNASHSLGGPLNASYGLGGPLNLSHGLRAPLNAPLNVSPWLITCHTYVFCCLFLLLSFYCFVSIANWR